MIAYPKSSIKQQKAYLVIVLNFFCSRNIVMVIIQVNTVFLAAFFTLLTTSVTVNLVAASFLVLQTVFTIQWRYVKLVKRISHLDSFI